MITSSLKKILLKRKISKLKSEEQSSSLSGKAGLIIDAENIEEKLALLEFYKKAGIKKENFTVIFLGKDDVPEGMDVLILEPGLISFGGEFKTEDFQEFLANHYDFLLCSFSKEHWEGAFLVSSVSSGLKIGMKPDSLDVIDIEIDTRDIEIFQQESLKYLKIFKRIG